MNRIRIFLGTLLILLLSACNSNTLDVEKVIEEAIKAQENLDSYYAKVSQKMVFDGEEVLSTYKEWMKKPNKHRMESDDGMLFVTDGKTHWMYDETSNTVMVDEGLEEIEAMPSEAEMMKEMITYMVDNNTVDILGTEKIAGQQSVLLSLEPKPDSEESLLGGQMEVWLDQKTWIPIKMVIKDTDFEMVMTYESIEYDIELEDSIFTFTPPEGATVETFEDYMPISMSIEEVRNEADFYVPEITELPQGFEFYDGFYEEEFNMVMLDYMKDMTDNLSLTITNQPEDFYMMNEQEEGHKVLVNGNEGILMEIEEMYFLSWNDGELYFDLMGIGSGITEETMVKTAESVK